MTATSATPSPAASPRLLVVSNRAPIEVTHGAERRVRRTVGGLASALDDAIRRRSGSWIAWTGVSDVIQPAETGLDYPITSVPLSDREVEHYYAGFSNQVLWPLCHMFLDRCRFKPQYWQAYRSANAQFARSVREVAHPGDLVWINDFHLCLVPGMLRSERADLALGVFWHTPFPPAAIFGVLAWREEVLRGLLGADVIGLQTEPDVRNFLDCARQHVGCEVDEARARVRIEGREVRIVALPVGIDAPTFERRAVDDDVLEQRDQLRAAIGAEAVLLGVDRLDYTKGILERLRGYELFLERHPRWRRRCSLVQVTVPSRDRVSDYRDMKRSIDEIVGRIMGRFTQAGRSPIIYLYRGIEQHRLTAYYAAADIALVTPLRDGMNLVAKEFVACHAARGEGTLVLSEFAGAARDLQDAVLVNPYDPEDIATAIETAVGMPFDERERRMRSLAARVRAHDIHWWTDAFLTLLADPSAPVPAPPGDAREPRG
jgi:trehalose 6-phosphate synthase/phosphatase